MCGLAQRSSESELELIPLRQQADAVTFAVKVRPRARHQRISGVHEEALKLEVTAPPVEGAANDACIRFFAKLLKVPLSSVTITAGLKNRNKAIRVAGVSAEYVNRILAEALSS